MTPQLAAGHAGENLRAPIVSVGLGARIPLRQDGQLSVKSFDLFRLASNRPAVSSHCSLAQCVCAPAPRWPMPRTSWPFVVNPHLHRQECTI
jgi:hypothetical protein